MIQVYADERLVYDSRLPDLALQTLKATCSVTKAGTVELTMPPGHPAMGYFTAYRTVITIYKDNVLQFRGRALFPSDDFYGSRTITGEGERGFLRDGVMRPYLYQDSPAAIFAHVISLYNPQVDEFKQFVVGDVTVTDPNNYIRFESEQAEQIADTIDKLVERCGGYIVFTTNAEGNRVINWYESLGYRSDQVIEFGNNLLDYMRSDSNDELATVVIPYGANIETATDEENGETTGETTRERVTITSVNGGLDFIQDYDAVALRGVIARPMYWDDITEPQNLLAAAKKWLATHKLVTTSLELTALDLSDLDKNIDAFREGDLVRVRSKPHSLDADFLLYERTYNFLEPTDGKVVLGQDIFTLTGSDAAGDRKTLNELNRVNRQTRADYQLGIAAAVQAVETTLSSLIEQTAEAIKLEVSETYATAESVESAISTRMTQLSDSFLFEFETLTKVISENDAYAREQFAETYKYIRFIDGDIVLGEDGSSITLRLENDRIVFLDDGAEVAYINNKQLYITDAHFLHSLRLGNFAFMPRENGNLSLVKVG